MRLPTPSVFITGASTGIGRDCALTLERQGYRVFAGVRRESDGNALVSTGTSKLTPVICDVGDYSSIARAAKQVEQALDGAGLDGLVNNAGISVSGPMELLPMELFERQMRVNVTGQVAVTQAFLPLLRRNRGRIVFIGSESGLVTLPLLGAYSASKHALEAVANAFRLELLRFGIRVAIIEPASVKSEIWNKAIESGVSVLKDDAETRAHYADDLRLLELVPKLTAKIAPGPEIVTRAVEHALGARSPKARYLVGLEARFLTLFMGLTPTRLSDPLIRTAARLLVERLRPEQRAG